MSENRLLGANARPSPQTAKSKKQSNHGAHERPIFRHPSLRRKWSYGRRTFRRAWPTHPGYAPSTAKLEGHGMGDANEVSAGTSTSWALAASPSSPRPGRARGRSSDTAGRPLRRPTVLGARGGGATATGSATCTYGAGDQGPHLGKLCMMGAEALFA